MLLAALTPEGPERDALHGRVKAEGVDMSDEEDGEDEKDADD